MSAECKSDNSFVIKADESDICSESGVVFSGIAAFGGGSAVVGDKVFFMGVCLTGRHVDAEGLDVILKGNKCRQRFPRAAAACPG